MTFPVPGYGFLLPKHPSALTSGIGTVKAVRPPLHLQARSTYVLLPRLPPPSSPPLLLLFLLEQSCQREWGEGPQSVARIWTQTSAGEKPCRWQVQLKHRRGEQSPGSGVLRWEPREGEGSAVYFRQSWLLVPYLFLRGEFSKQIVSEARLCCVCIAPRGALAGPGMAETPARLPPPPAPVGPRP